MTKKYEREIVEILERMERQGESLPPARPRRERSRPRWTPPSLASLTPRAGSLLWLGLVLGLPLAAALLNGIVPWLAAWLVLAGIFVFLSPLVGRLVGLVRYDERRLWRGRVIEVPYRGNSFGAWWRYQLWTWRHRFERWRNRR